MAKRKKPRNEDPPAQRTPALDWLMSHKQPELLPTPWLTDSELEDFTESLLMSQRLLGTAVRHVAHIERWGVPGDKQDGIDFFGRFTDDVLAAWQVKQLVQLSAADVRKAVNAMTFENADEHYLVYGGIAKKQARDEILNYATWTLLDRRTLTEMVRLLPGYSQRELIERFWGPDVRRMFITGPGDAFVSLDAFRSGRMNPAALMNDVGPLAGRSTELDCLADAMDTASERFRQVIVVSGPGGRGKSRLVIEALTAQQDREPTRPILCLSSQRTFDPAAMSELRPMPSIVFVDDAHNDPPGLAPLLGALRNAPGIQLILATRPSSVRAVEERIAAVPFGPHEQTTIDVEELELKDARTLTKGLLDGLDLRFDLRNYLADQARHSPHVAVILTNLIRTRQLTGAIAVDTNLRNLVLHRYQEVLVPGDIDGIDAKVIQRVIATYAALQSVPTSDETLQGRIATFCKLTVIELAQIYRVLVDRGIIIAQGERARVVPDVLADRVIEMTAAFEKHDTGFVAELWNEFGADHRHQLALSLGELDWRLSHSKGPNVMAAVWEDVRSRLSTPYCARLCSELDHLEPLSATQPTALIAALDELRLRLDDDEAAGLPLPEDQEDQALRRLWSVTPLNRNDVRAKLPNLYARVAANAPDLLEQALDALWALRARDGRATHNNPEHADRMLSDRLANLAALPDASFPERIVARVSLWVEQLAQHDDVATPLFALKPLLVKEQLETVQATFHSLQFRPHLISAAAMRPVRDQIRALLLTQGASTDVRLAAAAVDLLGEALRAPHGYFAQPVGTESILKWEDDDLATIDTLDQIARTSASPVIRRKVREVISWSSEHARSLRLRHAAMTLAARLDATTDLDDQVAGLVLGGDWVRSLDRIEQVPTLEELTDARHAEEARTQDFTDEQREHERMERIHSKVQAREQQVTARFESIARRLVALEDAKSTYDLLDRTAREVRLARSDKNISLMRLWNQFAELAPELLGAFAVNISASEPGPLDNALDYIVDRWVQIDPDDAFAWVDQAVQAGRKEVRLAIAAGFSRSGWQQHSAQFARVWTRGLADEDPDVIQAFLSGAGGYLRSSPAEAIGVLLEHDISPFGAGRVLEDACAYDGNVYGSSLDRDTASTLLPLLTRAGLGNYVVQEIVTGIAKAQPLLVLDYLLSLIRAGGTVDDDIHDLRTAFDQHADVLAGWVRSHLDVEPAAVGYVLSAAVNDRLTVQQAGALAGLCDGLSASEVGALVGCLAPIGLWAVHSPPLAEAVMQQARATETDEEVFDSVRSDGMSLRGWGWINGVSEELNSARDAAAQAAIATRDDDLRTGFLAARDAFQRQIDEMAAKHQRAEDEDW